MTASDHLSPEQFFHGTNQHFEPGDVLLPSAETGKVASGIREPSPHVFVSKYMRHAGDWGVNAAMTAGGSHHDARVYEVRPEGALSDDPLERGSGYRTTRAVVVGTVARKRWSRGAAAYED